MEHDYVKNLQAVIKESSDEDLTVLNRLLETFEKSEKNADIAKCLYQSIDDITEELADIYIYFINSKIDVSWFYFAKTIQEERENASEYFATLKTIVPGKLTLEKVEEFFNQDNGDYAFFCKEIDKCYKQETEETKTDAGLHANSFERSQRELESVRCELMDVRTELFHSNIKNAELEEEICTLRKENETSQSRLFILNKQLCNKDQQFTMITNVNSTLTKENAELEKIVAELKESKEKSASEIQFLNDKIIEEARTYAAKVNELSLVISDLENKISNLQNNKELIEPKEVQSEWSQSESESDIDELILDDINEPSINNIGNILMESEDDLLFPEPEIPVYDDSEDTNTQYNQESIFDDIDISENDLTEIKDNSATVKKEGHIFHSFANKLAAIAFNKIDVKEQDTKIFSLMMSNKYTKDQVAIVRELLDKVESDKRFSKYDIYSLIKRNATLEELQSFFKKVA